MSTDDVLTQDPPSEPKWLWRRAFIWFVTTLSMIAVGFVVALAPRNDLQTIALALIGLVGVMSTIYLIAPSAEEIAKIVGAWRAGKP